MDSAVDRGGVWPHPDASALHTRTVMTSHIPSRLHPIPSHFPTVLLTDSPRLARPSCAVLSHPIPSGPRNRKKKSSHRPPRPDRMHARHAHPLRSHSDSPVPPSSCTHARTHAHMHAGRPLGPPRACVAGRTGTPPFSRWYHAYRKGCAGSALKGRLEGMGWVSHRFWAVVDRWREGVG